MPPYVFRVTKYDPADRDEHGWYVGALDSDCDHGPVEAAYLEAVAAFAEDTGIDRLAIREPALASWAEDDPKGRGTGLAALFADGLAGYHDGAEVSIPVARELVRIMLRDEAGWWRLEREGRFLVHVGYDQYVYVGSDAPCERATARTRELGLFPERIAASPYEHEAEPGEQRPADDDFWAAVVRAIPEGGALLLEECHVHSASRWHWLTRAGVDAVRARLAPRALLMVWPDLLSTDLAAVPDAVAEVGVATLIWEDAAGRLASRLVDDEQHDELTAVLAGARAAAVLPLAVDDANPPLLTGVRPDDDGVLRARWRTEPAPSDLRWSLLRTFHRGEVRTGTVTAVPDFGVFVDLDVEGLVSVAEPSWRHVDHPSEIAEVGQQVTVEILDVDLPRERVSLSLKRCGN